MTLLRIRLLRSVLIVGLILATGLPAAAGQAAAGRGAAAAAPQAASPRTAPGRETSAASVASYGLSQMMPVDPEVTIGTLPNGLKYYVRANAKPAHRVEMRLVVRAGSVLEDPDQQGLAHFVEHMEFEGTRNFPRQGIIQFLASLGLGIGPDANAVTSYDDTQVHASPADRFPRRDRSRNAGARRLGPHGDLRRGSHRARGAASSCPSGGNTSAPPNGRSTRFAACSSRVAICQSPAHRRSRHPREGDPRTARALLQRLVSTESDGGHRRR